MDLSRLLPTRWVRPKGLYSDEQVNVCNTPEEVYRLVLNKKELPARPSEMPSAIWLTPYLLQEALRPFAGTRHASREFSNMTIFVPQGAKRLGALRRDRGERDRTVDSEETINYWRQQRAGHAPKALIAYHNHPTTRRDTALASAGDTKFVNENPYIAFMHLVAENTGLTCVAATANLRQLSEERIDRCYDWLHENSMDDTWLSNYRLMFHAMGYEVYAAPWTVFDQSAGIQLHRIGLSDLTYLNWDHTEDEERSLYPGDNDVFRTLLNDIHGSLNDFVIGDY